jgi:23S rRNA (uracil1939-C5)-methyltransferase
MHLEPGSVVTLDIEKPIAGGRMLTRHEGQVVLVWGAIPGERVRARVERIAKGVVYAETVDVSVPSPNRRPAAGDWRCGGNVLAHVDYPRQLQLKVEIIRDAFARIARLSLPHDPGIVGSPEEGYRMRARLHAAGARLGFFREGTHELCAAAVTQQLLPSTVAWIDSIEQALREERLTGLGALEIAENLLGDERACHLELQAGTDTTRFAGLANTGGLVGLSAERSDRPGVECLYGTPVVGDVVHVCEGDPAPVLRLRRNVRSFFQSNRYLLERLVRHIVGVVPDGPVVDLYAGVGLFGLSLAAAGVSDVTLVEGDPVSARDLAHNAEAFRNEVKVERGSVEDFLQSGRRTPKGRPHSTFIVDPPRTGLSKEAAQGVIHGAPFRLVYVSCDVATLARDARTLVEAGYRLDSITSFDLFPNTAHVETVVSFRI